MVGEATYAILEFFQSGKLLRGLNSTNLVLLPKTDVPRQAGDYRHITCCGVVYKCIAKLHCERLKKVLYSLVDENQAAFVEDKSIIHNILIGQELVRLYKRQKVLPRVLMKIDIKKTYDSVNWSFLRELMWHMKFPQEFIEWVM